LQAWSISRSPSNRVRPAGKLPQITAVLETICQWGKKVTLANEFHDSGKQSIEWPWKRRSITAKRPPELG